MKIYFNAWYGIWLISCTFNKLFRVKIYEKSKKWMCRFKVFLFSNNIAMNHFLISKLLESKIKNYW